VKATDKKIRKISSIQKVIKVGDSLAVTIPAKDARFNGIEEGDYIHADFTSTESAQGSGASQVDEDYKKFVDQYGEALKNLADR
jgi:bifunctional DNA-binding transcriptional regulator/antitoxin component of YhaV-PrlF toxin-antitoxin module